MRVERSNVVLRPRSGLETVDLGFAMARQWWRPLAFSWLALVVPMAAAVVLALRDHALIAVAMLWWLRPVFARVPLFVLSRELFGERAGVGEVARALPSLLSRGLFTSLFTQRFSPARAMLLPVLQLEGLEGPARRRRCAVLAQRDLGTCLGTVAVLAHLSAVVMTGLALLIFTALPEEWLPELSERWSALGDGAARDLRWLLFPALYFAATSLVEPLLCAAGFALYLNRRVMLEGWDLELAFRRLATRTATLARAALVCLALLCALPGPLRAETVEACDPQDAASSRACMHQLLQSEDFSRTEEVMGWRLREGLFDDDDKGSEDDASLAWLAEWIAAFGELLLWLALAAAVVAVGVALFGMRRGERLEAEAEAPPARLFGLDVERSELPEDVVGAAQSAWARGDRALALSLLYRGALVALVHGAELRVPAGATELECVDLVRQLRPNSAQSFRVLTLAWMSARYAENPPEDDAFHSICGDFERAFGTAP